MADDTYKTITAPSEGTYSQLRSKFLAFASPVRTVDEAMAFVAAIQKKYYDARHCCYAYMIGSARDTFRANDNGEPSGTAGKPILGQINSAELTDIVIAVVRYFGGIKLGTSGLIQAYRAAAAEAIAAATIVEKTIDRTLHIQFDYLLMNAHRQGGVSHRSRPTLRQPLLHDARPASLRDATPPLPPRKPPRSHYRGAVITGMEEAEEDIRLGRVFHADNVDEMFKQILG